jgi:hypothetical protein
MRILLVLITVYKSNIVKFKKTGCAIRQKTTVTVSEDIFPDLARELIKNNAAIMSAGNRRL